MVLKVDRVGMTANNVTYAVFGDAMKYWDFFPAGDRDGVAYGRVPLWGFAVVEQSRVPGVEEGTRLLRLPPDEQPPRSSSRPGSAPKGFRDASAHRAAPPVAVQRDHDDGRRPRRTTPTSRTCRSSTARCS